MGGRSAGAACTLAYLTGCLQTDEYLMAPLSSWPARMRWMTTHPRC